MGNYNSPASVGGYAAACKAAQTQAHIAYSLVPSSFKSPSMRMTPHEEKQAHNRLVQMDFREALFRRNVYLQT